MEIPYTVTARKDTGLFNSKVGIWLFLASEVMLFGGLFSGYVFLRIYADYPWPERTLPVLPGLINTFVLIGSSVTVVFAWAALKMRQWRRFQVFMGITIACAAIFMVLKGIEYGAKWGHQAVRMDDYAIIEGHTHKAYLDDDGHFHAAHGEEEEKREDAFEANRVVFKTSEIQFDLTRFHPPYVEDMLKQAGDRGSKIVLADAIEGRPNPKTDMKTVAAAGDELSVGLLRKARKLFIAARANNAEVRTKELQRLWRNAKNDRPGEPGYVLAKDVQIDDAVIAPKIVPASGTAVFRLEPPVPLVFKRGRIRESEETARLKDDTVLRGHLEDCPMVLGVDAVDFRYMAQKAEYAGKDPMAVIEGSWIFSDENSHAKDFKRVWQTHKERIAKLEEKLAEADREPTDTERYRIGWKDLVQYARAEKKGVGVGDDGFAKLRPTMTEGFAGPDHYDKEIKELHAFLELEIPNEKILLESKFTPKWNTYYAIYFTLTGLHGLHVVGGAIVLAYYLFFSKGLYLRNPEWLANRVEVGGLFWHFVDLVWIFLFPILYLM